MRRIKILIGSALREFSQDRAMLCNYSRTIQSYKNTVRRASYWLCLSVVSWTMQMGLSACEDEWRFDKEGGAVLGFSMESVDFDTLFTGVSSATATFMIYNTNSTGVRFDAVLCGGESSPFNINVDGEGGASIAGLEIPPHDSLFCFVRVHIEPTSEASLREVRDSVRFILENGIVQYVKLEASGQNVVRLKGVTIKSDSTLTSRMPYQIEDTLRVAIGATLTIQPGAQLYFHKDAVLDVMGRVVARGTRDSMIVMRGDRLDEMIPGLRYDDVDGQWGGITVRGCSYDNLFEYCDIHSGTYGIKADSSTIDHTKISLISSVINNVSGNGLEATQCKLFVANSQLTNAGGSCVDIAGGESQFLFCTIAGFSLWNGGDKAVRLMDNRDGWAAPLMGATFRNCIITGRHSTEFVVDVVDSLRDKASFFIANSLLMVADTTDVRYKNVAFERVGESAYGATNFVDGTLRGYKSVFLLDSLSMARGIADTLSAAWPLDLAGVERPSIGADAGCYQYVIPK